MSEDVSAMMKRTSEGLSEVVRSARMPLSVVVIAIVAPVDTKEADYRLENPDSESGQARDTRRERSS